MKNLSKILVVVILLTTLLTCMAGLNLNASAVSAGDTLYFKPESGWKGDCDRYAAYFFKSSGNTWVSMTDSDGDGIYECKVPSGGYTNVIFVGFKPNTSGNNWNNKKQQTVDLTLGSDNYFILENPWNGSYEWKGTGSWSYFCNGNHTWNSGTVTKVATCSAAGTKSLTCTKCSEKKTETIPKLDHAYESGVCSSCGALDPNACAHTSKTPVNTATCTQAGKSYMDCDGCDEIFDEVDAPALGHDYVNGECSRCDMRIVYFVNAGGWATVSTHMWGTNVTGTDWPGVAMTKVPDLKVNGYDVYSIETDIAYENIIFNNNNNGAQTADLTFTAGNYYDMSSQKWYADVNDIPVIDRHSTNNFLAGSFNGWSATANEFRLDDINGSVGYVVVNLDANSKYQFKVVKSGSWTGFSDLTLNTSDGTEGKFTQITTEDTSYNNVEFTTECAGEYIFAFDGKTLTVTFIKHEFTQEEAVEGALKTKATCQKAAVYYKSCSCGTVGTEDTFVYGDPDTVNGHHLVDVDAKAPTCTTPGYTAHKKCDLEDCTHTVGKESVTDAEAHADSDHNHICDNECGKTNIGDHEEGDDHECAYCHESDDGWVCRGGATPTCQAGSVCSVCGKTYVDPNPDNHVYDYENGQYTYPTCKADGYTTYTCPCGAKEVTTATGTATGNHTGGTATCKTLAVCSVCGDSYGSLAQHTYDNDLDNECNVCYEERSCLHASYSITTVAPTCTTGGYTRHECDACDYYFDDDEKSPLQHVDEDKDHVCDRTNCTQEMGTHEDKDKNHTCDYGCSVSIGDHVDGDKNHTCDYGCAEKIGTHNGTATSHICEYCGEKATEHNWVAKNGLEPTCTEAGYSDYEKCSICGHEQGKEHLGALDHDWLDATCDAPMTCDRCHVTSGSVRPHSMGAWVVATPAELGKTGVERRDCGYSNCDHYETREIAALLAVYFKPADKWVSDNAIYAAWVWSEGVDGRWVYLELVDGQYVLGLPADCTNIIFAKLNSTPAAGDWSNVAIQTSDIEDIRATVEAGNNCYVLTKFNTKDTAGYWHPVSGHNYDEGKVTTAATCGKNGVKTYTCTVEGCGHSYTEVMTATGAHSWTPATFDAPKTCSTCGEKDGDALVAVAQIGEQRYETLQDAVAAAQNGDVIVLVSDVVLENSLVIPTNKTVVLDLAGYTVSQSKECTDHYAMIDNKGNLTITGNGKLSFTDTSAGNPSFNWGSYTIANYGTLVVENGTVEHLGAQTFATHMICAIWQYSGSTTINDGVFSTPNYRSVRLWKGDMTINGGTFDGQLWVQSFSNETKLTINGGTFGPNGGDGSSVFVTNNEFPVALAITGGNFTTKIGASIPADIAGAITGGTFATDVSAFVAEGYHLMNGAVSEHSYDAGVITTPAGCETKGVITYTCECKHTYTDEVDSIGHLWNDGEVTTTPGCTTTGVKTYTCQNDANHTKTEEVQSKGHSYEKVVTAPTCTEGGYTTYTCACGDTYTGDATESTGHKDTDNDHYCDNGDCDEKVSDHTGGEATCQSGAICTICGNAYGEVDSDNHNYGEGVVTAPTCKDEGYTTYTCACSDSYTSDRTPATGKHTGGTATCQKLAECETCGTPYGELGTHTYDAEGFDKDCNTPGCDHVRTCAHNGDKEVIPGTPATCTTPGFTAGEKCAICGEVTVARQETGLADHVWGTWTVTIAPTCTTAGEERHDCDNCDAFETRRVEKLGHDYDAVVTAPTCAEQGFTTHTCKNEGCGNSYVDSFVEKLPHEYSSEVTKEPTCTEKGVKTFTCECGKSYTEEVAATGHSYGEGVVTAPTCTAEGYTTYTCACGDSYTDSYTDKVAHADNDSDHMCDGCGEVKLSEHAYMDGVCVICGEQKPADDDQQGGEDQTPDDGEDNQGGENEGGNEDDVTPPAEEPGYVERVTGKIVAFLTKIGVPENITYAIAGAIAKVLEFFAGLVGKLKF